MVNLHPKVRAAAIAALVTAVVSVAAAVADAYPSAWWAGVLSAIIPVVAGYMKSAEPASE